MKLGVTGGIASGKSTVVQYLKDLGAVTIDADEISRSLTSPGTPLTKAILEYFGIQYSLPGRPDALNRSKLAQTVFQDESLRRKLESITHPVIVDEMACRMSKEAERTPDAVIAVEVPLLYEACLETLFDKVLVVWSTLPTQRARLKSRIADLSEKELMERILSQMSLEKKRAKADFVIDSEKPLDAVKEDVTAVYELLMLGGYGAKDATD